MSKKYYVPLKVVVVYHLDTDTQIDIKTKESDTSYCMKLNYDNTVLANGLLVRSSDEAMIVQGSTQVEVDGAKLKSLWRVFKQYSHQWDNFITNS